MDRNPKHGCRFQLDRLRVEDTTATYAVHVMLPEQRFLFEVDFERSYDASVSVTAPRRCPDQEPENVEPPEWAMTHLDALLRQVARSAKNADAWPRRLRRWKEASSNE
ncbi:MAG: hypothetical protein KC561_09440 [Myxococcales bacterium]|nr:hypothetical protein [Myxococcales bacterium]